MPLLERRDILHYYIKRIDAVLDHMPKKVQDELRQRTEFLMQRVLTDRLIESDDQSSLKNGALKHLEEYLEKQPQVSTDT